MIVAVVPLCNEENEICGALDNLAILPIDVLIIVVNGCVDNSLKVVKKYKTKALKKIIFFKEPLGVDVPRAMGVRYAKMLNANLVLFLDGDISGNISASLYKLICDVSLHKVDLALTNCYPYPNYRSKRAKEILSYREKLNRTLGIFNYIGLASPSHGPHCVSKKVIDTLPLEAFAIPPLELSMCVKNNFKVRVSTKLDDFLWHSKERGEEHNQKIAQTIIGDCIYSENYFKNQKLSRNNFIGYNNNRRFDLLNTKEMITYF